MTPLMCCSQPAAVNIAPRNPMRFCSVFSTPMLLRRLPIVLVLSSAARMPLPGATSAFAVCASCDLSILVPLCLWAGGGPPSNGFPVAGLLGAAASFASSDAALGRHGGHGGHR